MFCSVGDSDYLGWEPVGSTPHWDPHCIRAAPLPRTVKVRSQLPGIMNFLFPLRTDLLALGLGQNFSLDNYSCSSSLRSEIAQ